MRDCQPELRSTARWRKSGCYSGI